MQELQLHHFKINISSFRHLQYLYPFHKLGVHGNYHACFYTVWLRHVLILLHCFLIITCN